MDAFPLGPFSIPIAGMVMVCVIVFIRGQQRANEKELDARHALQLREMEHQQKMKEMELELAKLNAAKAQPESPANS